MLVSKRNNPIAFLLISLLPLSGCTTSSYYRVIGRASFRTEIQVTPDRVLLECEDIKDHANAGDPAGNFGFMIHVLDEEDTVLTVIQEPVTNRKYCFKRLDDIAKILRGGKSIYIGGHGTIDEPRKKESLTYSFPEKSGVFHSNGRVLQFSVIQNEHGKCYSAHNATDSPCMPEEFPIKRFP